MNPNDTPQPRHYQNDEIDLIELVQNLWAQKWLIIGITALVTAAAVIYALAATPIYETSARVTPPSHSNVMGYNFAPIVLEASIVDSKPDASNQPQFQQYTVDDVYNIFKRNLLSQRLRSQFFEQYYLPYRGVNLDAEEVEETARDQLLRQFSNILRIEQVDRDQPDHYRVRVELADPVLASEWANRYLEMADARARTEMATNIEMELETHADAASRSLENRRIVAQQKREDRIVRLQEALTIAEALGIDRSDMAIGRTSADSSLAAYVEGDLLYLRGTQPLQAELAALQARKDDSAFVPELRELENREELLRTIEFEPEGVAVFTLDSPAEVPETPIKPNKRLIVMLGVVLGGVIGTFLALISMAVARHKSLDPAV